MQNALVRLATALTFAYAVWFAYAEWQLDAFQAVHLVPPPAPWTPPLTWLSLALLFMLPMLLHRALYQPELERR